MQRAGVFARAGGSTAQTLVKLPLFTGKHMGTGCIGGRPPKERMQVILQMRYQ